MTRPTDPAFQALHEAFDGFRRRAEATGRPFSHVDPRRFEAVESFEELRTPGTPSRLAAVRVAFRLAAEDGDRRAFFRLEAHFLTGAVGYGAFAADRQLMDSERGHVSFHALYESRREEAFAIGTGAHLAQLGCAAMRLEQEGRTEAAEAICRLLETQEGEMPQGHRGAPEFDLMSEFRL